MDLAASGHEVLVADNYLRRRIAEQTDSDALFQTPSLTERARIFEERSGKHIGVRIGDCCDDDFMRSLFIEFKPEVAVHYAEQPLSLIHI